MEKEIVNQVQEAQRVSYRLSTRRNMPRHILMKLTKTKHKERILNSENSLWKIIKWIVLALKWAPEGEERKREGQKTYLNK